LLLPKKCAGLSKRRKKEARDVPLGLDPSWAKDPAIGNKMINARAETVSEKPSFSSAFKKRRC
jgi:putative SOS response-associated peptidase YedK